MNKSDKIFLAGHNGLVGSSIYNFLKKKKFKKIIIINKKNLDLLNQENVFKFLKKHKPKYVILAAATVGGIKANYHHMDKFLYENLQIQNNVIHGSFINGVKNLIFYGSSCIYPIHAKQPFKENTLLTGKLEPTNEGYALAKISGIKLCEYYNKKYNLNYKCLMPCNIYGPNDRFNDVNSHFIPAILSKLHIAKVKGINHIKLWGTGKPKREIMFVDDLADATLYFLKKKTKENLINIGTGKEKTIKEYANIFKSLIYKDCKVIFDNNKFFDGTKRKINSISISKKYGWRSTTELNEGILRTYQSLIKKINI